MTDRAAYASCLRALFTNGDEQLAEAGSFLLARALRSLTIVQESKIS